MRYINHFAGFFFSIIETVKNIVNDLRKLKHKKNKIHVRHDDQWIIIMQVRKEDKEGRKKRMNRKAD